jgi:hypothetical protein
MGERHQRHGPGVGSCGNVRGITIARANDGQICTLDEIGRNESGSGDISAVDALPIPSIASIRRPAVARIQVTPAPARNRLASGTRIARHRGSIPNFSAYGTPQYCISTTHAQRRLPPRRRRSCFMPQRGIDRRFEMYTHETGENDFACFNIPKTAPIYVHGQSGQLVEPPQLFAHDHGRFI